MDAGIIIICYAVFISCGVRAYVNFLKNFRCRMFNE